MTDQCDFQSDSIYLTITLEEANEFGSQLLEREHEDTSTVRVVEINESNKADVPTAKIKSVGNTGEVFVTFSQSMYNGFLENLGNNTRIERDLSQLSDCQMNATTNHEFWQCIKDEVLLIEVV